jgi:hypothetical protein
MPYDMRPFEADLIRLIQEHKIDLFCETDADKLAMKFICRAVDIAYVNAAKKAEGEGQ